MHKGSEYFLHSNECAICKGSLIQSHKPSGMSLLKRALRTVTRKRAMNESNDEPVFACKSYHVFHRYCLNGWCSSFKNQSRCSCPICRIDVFSNYNSREPAIPINPNIVSEYKPIYHEMAKRFNHGNDASWQNIDNEPKPSNTTKTPPPSTTNRTRKKYVSPSPSPSPYTRTHTRRKSKSPLKSKSKSIEKSHSNTKPANKPIPINRSNVTDSIPSHPFLRPKTTFYEILNILPKKIYTEKEKNVENKKLKKTYRSFYRIYHPDRCNNKLGEVLCKELFQKISNAHETLTDPEQNKRYYSELDRDITQSDIDKFQGEVDEMNTKIAENVKKEKKLQKSLERATAR
jgi:hypothetical protein